VDFVFDTHLIGGAVPLGAAVSVVLSLLKKTFKVRGNEARAAVAIVGALYFAYLSIVDFTLGGALNGLLAGFTTAFSAGGFYDWVGQHLETKVLKT